MVLARTGEQPYAHNAMTAEYSCFDIERMNVYQSDSVCHRSNRYVLFLC